MKKERKKERKKWINWTHVERELTKQSGVSFNIWRIAIFFHLVKPALGFVKVVVTRPGLDEGGEVIDTEAITIVGHGLTHQLMCGNHNIHTSYTYIYILVC